MSTASPLRVLLLSSIWHAHQPFATELTQELSARCVYVNRPRGMLDLLKEFRRCDETFDVYVFDASGLDLSASGVIEWLNEHYPEALIVVCYNGILHRAISGLDGSGVDLHVLRPVDYGEAGALCRFIEAAYRGRGRWRDNAFMAHRIV